MSDLKQRVARLSPEKLNLLMQRMKRDDAPAQRPPIQRRPDPSAAPMSFSQQRVWFIDQLDTGSYAHNLLSAIRLEGSLNIEALRATVQEIVARHEVLRASFQLIAGQAMQVIASDLHLPIQMIDLGLEADPEASTRALADQEALRPFDLSRGPMLRLTLVRIDHRHSVLLLAMHHIIGDGWSRTIFAREFASLYTEFSNGRSSPLPPVAVQYPDYAAWQRQWLAKEGLGQQLAYWKKQFERPAAFLSLPVDFARPPVQTFRGDRIRFHIEAGALERLNALADSESATVFMALLAVFKVLLSRYSRQEDIVVGSAVANRSLVETEGTIGFFANTIALRTDLSGNPSFREVLRRVRDVALGAYGNQELPFERLVQEIRPDRDLSRTPLFQVMFLLDNTAMEKIQAAGIVAELVDFDAKISPFDVSLHMEERRDGLHGGLEYNIDLFERSTIEAMIGAFRTLMEHAGQSPDIRIRDLRLVGRGETMSLHAPVKSGTPRRNAQSAPTVLTLIASHAAAHPERTAIAGVDRNVSYSELHRAAASIASDLAARGVGAEDVVALWGERTPDMIAAMIGIMRAGAAWLPFDPALPAARIKTILEDAGVHLIVGAGGRVPRIEGCAVVDIAEAASAEGAAGSDHEIDSRQLAYMIYTSGSTGTPKGVQIAHSALLHYTLAAIDAYGIGPDDRVLQFASPGFDAIVEEIFPTLAVGGALVLGGEAMMGTARRFLDASRQAEVSVWTLPTAFWSQMVKEIAVANLHLPDCLRLCIIGGERVDPERWDLWKRITPARVDLINTYGPTEATVIATFHSAHDDPADGRARREVSIGRPLPGCAALILDDALNPVPLGAPGELYLAGPNLSRGYRNDAALTARAFVPNPWTSADGGRLYRTGDIVRQRASGELEYLSRTDTQVKLRGFRIELAEIESVLTSHSDVANAAVVVAGDPAAARLVAFIVPRSPAQFDSEALKSYARTRLPEFMTPSAYVAVAHIPLNANGKVDRASLAAHDLTASRPRRSASPKTETEMRLAAIWSRLLGIPEPAPEDSFFELGGHSLMATAMVAEIAREFGIELTLRQVFENPAMASLARVIADAQSTAAEPRKLEQPLRPSLETASPATLLSILDQLSDEEVAQALKRITASDDAKR